MSFFNRLTAVFLAALLIGPLVPLEARTKKGDRFLGQGRAAESKKEWDAALEAYEQALSEDPTDIVYQMATTKARFQASQAHVDKGLKIRATGQLGEALLEFRSAFAINPGSPIAQQELMRTQDMIQRERKRVEQTGQEAAPEQRGLTPSEESKRQTREKIGRLLAVPELKPLNPDAVKNLKINGQSAKVVFDTIGKVAGINVLWDPEYTAPPKPMNVDFNDSTLEQSLDYVSVITKSYWKPLSPNTIFITNDNPNKRRDYAEMVAKTFYLSNVGTPQELQEIVNAVRSVSELQRVVAYNSQNAIIVRGEADQVSLAEKMIHDLDKARSEVVVDVLVMEASTIFKRQLTAALASTGLNIPIAFTPRSGLRVVPNPPTTTPSTNPNTTPSTPSTDTPAADTTAIPLSNLGRIASSDFSTVLPSALLQATLSDARTKVLQAPQIRSVDGVKASLKIGEREPTATGSFQPGIGGVGINPLVNTQFTYIDVGVNVDLTPHVHDNGDVSIHIELDISSVTGHVSLGGIDQPIIGQRKVTHDIRMHEGEVNLLGGLINQQDSKSVTGIPGLSSIPFLRRLFSGESVDRERGELMIVLIPHIVRKTELTPENLRGIAVGNATTIKLNYAPKASDIQTVAPPAAANPPAAAANPVAVVQPAAPPVTAPGTPVTPPATAPPATAPPVAAPPTTPPMASPPATAPPATAPPGAVPPPPGTGSARVVFLPATADTTVNGNVVVTVVLQGGADIAAAPLQVQFDPKMLRLNDVSRGDLLAGDGQQPQFTKSILNDAGSATVQLNRMPGTAGISGDGTLVVLNFTAINRGASPVWISNLALRNSQGQPIPASLPRMTVTIR
jgi:general secretion pathway protein D